MQISNPQDVRMSLEAAAAWFASVCAAIFVIFERVEKLSSKSDLELYYLLITVERTSLSSPWHIAPIRFFDKIFGTGKLVGPVLFPRLLRVIVFTTVMQPPCWR